MKMIVFDEIIGSVKFAEQLFIQLLVAQDYCMNRKNYFTAFLRAAIC